MNVSRSEAPLTFKLLRTMLHVQVSTLYELTERTLRSKIGSERSFAASAANSVGLTSIFQRAVGIMTPSRLQELIGLFPSRRIAVVGDFFLDKYLDTDPSLAETSVETGKRANQVVAVRCSPGAAGTVVNNLAALGLAALGTADLGEGRLFAVGAIGDDGEAYELRRGLEQLGCRTDGLLPFDSLMTPTYLKPRDRTRPGLAGEFERYDTKNRLPTPQNVVDRVIDALDDLLPDVDAVIIADQVEADDCGIITAQMRDVLSDRAGRHPAVIFWADSRTHIRLFRGVTIKPNQFEAVGHTDPEPGDIVNPDVLSDAVGKLRTQNNAPLCVTLGEQGILVSDPELTAVPGVRLEGPLDPTGAGDSVTAGAVLALASGATLAEAALVGNLVASLTVQQLGTTGTATPQQLVERLELWRAQHEQPE